MSKETHRRHSYSSTPTAIHYLWNGAGNPFRAKGFVLSGSGQLIGVLRHVVGGINGLGIDIVLRVLR